MDLRPLVPPLTRPGDLTLLRVWTFSHFEREGLHGLLNASKVYAGEVADDTAGACIPSKRSVSQ